MTKREMFDKGLETQKQHFDKMINAEKPKEIDFSDSKKDLPLDNLDAIMGQTLADREKELRMITNQYSNKDREAAQKWLQSEQTDSVTETPKIKIDRSSNLALNTPVNIAQPVKAEKRVHFNIEEKDDSSENKSQLNDFLLKLKKKSNDNSSINDINFRYIVQIKNIRVVLPLQTL